MNRSTRTTVLSHDSDIQPEDVTHVVVMPPCSHPLLAAALDICAPPPQGASHHPASLLGSPSAPNASYLRDTLMLAMPAWTPQHFTAALAQVTPGHEACEVLLRGMATGGIKLVSGAALLPEVAFSCAPDAFDAGLAHSSLHLPGIARDEERSGGGPRERSAHRPSPQHVALRGWLQVLPWPELGYSSALKRVLAAINKLENPSDSAKTRGARSTQKNRKKRKVEGDVHGPEGSSDLDSDLDLDAAGAGAPAKRVKRSARADRGVGALADDSYAAAGVNESAEEASEAPAGRRKKGSNVATRFARRRPGAPSKQATAKAAAPEPSAALQTVPEDVEKGGTSGGVAAAPRISAALLEDSQKPPSAEPVDAVHGGTAGQGAANDEASNAAQGVHAVVDPSQPLTQHASGGGRRRRRKRGALDPAFGDDDSMSVDVDDVIAASVGQSQPGGSHPHSGSGAASVERKFDASTVATASPIAASTSVAATQGGKASGVALRGGEVMHGSTVALEGASNGAGHPGSDDRCNEMTQPGGGQWGAGVQAAAADVGDVAGEAPKKGNLLSRLKACLESDSD